MKKRTKKPRAAAKKATQKKVGHDLMLVHNPVKPEQEFFIASELADDDMIEQEITGQVAESYVYSYVQDGKPVTGLSVTGVNETARKLTRNPKSGYKIRIVPESVKIERDVEMGKEKGVMVTLFAENMITGETGVGVKFEPYIKTGRKGAYNNTFAVEKAVSKAERNAKRKLIPEKAAIEMIKMFIKQGSFKQIEPPAYQKSSAPAQKPANNVNYLGQLKTVLWKNGGKTEGEAVDLFNEVTGNNIKSLRVNQGEAKQMLWDLLNAPNGGKLKK